ncbi:MAG TPA: hypothetical protein PLJ60_09500 [Chryseolinea sp.]|nr:hypothetical protein [Chryseolinea sp.]HPM30558.1 hypothetical protein [Chryseolinea sp.]
MSWCRCWLFTTILSASSTLVVAQDADSVLLHSEDLLTVEDSLSIFNLIDSLLALPQPVGSQLAIRMGYNSNVLSAGRTLGIENFGLAPGISFYHISGLVADVTSYWSKDFDPSYYLTVTSIGYMHDFSKHFSILAGYDHYFYNVSNNSYIPYQNTLYVTPIVEFKPVNFSLGYSFYFGDQQVHRLMPSIGFTFEKRKWLGLSRVALLPTASVLWGNEQISTIEYVAPKTLAEAIENFRKYGWRFSPVLITENKSGIMNYTFSLPLNITYKNWSFMFTYSYNIPKALPGETLTFSESSYLSGSLAYYIPFKQRKFKF